MFLSEGDNETLIKGRLWQKEMDWEKFSQKF